MCSAIANGKGNDILDFLRSTGISEDKWPFPSFSLPMPLAPRQRSLSRTPALVKLPPFPWGRRVSYETLQIFTWTSCEYSSCLPEVSYGQDRPTAKNARPAGTPSFSQRSTRWVKSSGKKEKQTKKPINVFILKNLLVSSSEHPDVILNSSITLDTST